LATEESLADAADAPSRTSHDYEPEFILLSLMNQAPKSALAVEGQQADSSTLQTHKHRTQQHKNVPRWLRMSLRTAILVGLIALPTLAVKEPSFEKLTQYK
jgi:hypothetical protein